MITVVDILKILSSGENYIIKINDYNRISEETVDTFNLFEKDEVQKATKFNISGHDMRANVSITQYISGKVKLNPKQAARVGLPNVITVNPLIKQRVIIRDGKLNCSDLDLIIDLNTCIKLSQLNVPFTKIENPTSTQGMAINLKLDSFNIIDNKFYNVDYESIQNQVKEVNTLKAKQKVINGLLSEIKTEQPTLPGFSKEQVELLEDHGLNSSLQYVGVNNVTKKSENQYSGNIINYKVSGSTCSTFKAMLERVRDGKKLNNLDSVQYEYYLELNNLFISNPLSNEEKKFLLSQLLKEIKSTINKIKLELTMTKILSLNSSIQEMAFDSNNPFKFKELTVTLKEEVFNK